MGDVMSPQESFEAVIGAVLGDAVDARAAWDVVSKMNDPSEVHVPRALEVARGGARKARKGLRRAKDVGDAVRVATPRGKALDRTSAMLVAKADADDVLAPIIAARRDGVITSEQAIAMAEEITKKLSFTGSGPVSRAAHVVRRGARRMTNKPNLGGPSRAQMRAGMQDARKKGFRNLAIIGGASTVAGGGYALSKPKKIDTTGGTTFGKSDGPELGWTGEISKVDEDKRQVFGWCSLTSVDGEPVVDRQGDYIPLEEIEKAAYHYVLSSRKGGDMHERDGEGPRHTADLIESFLVTPEKLKHMGLDENALPHGWWIGMKVNDDTQWELVKKQERTGFSIHGKGSRIEKVL